MRPRPAPLAVALVGAIALGATTQCSLLAPSDGELMGGDQDAASDATSDAGDAGGDGSSVDGASPGDGSSVADGTAPDADSGPCLQETFGCGGQTPCCSGLTCDSVAHICLPSSGICSPKGGPCPGGSSAECCSQSCINHVCK